MEKTTSREYVEWMVFLERAWQEKDKEEYYHALIAAEVRRANVKDPRSVKMEDLLLTFKAEEKEVKPPCSPEEAEERMAVSKAFWSAVMAGAKNVRD